jgi:pumilio RNA-binding family
MGATAVAGGLFLDDDLCADPDYQSYYYSNVHLNRLPPSHLSRN